MTRSWQFFMDENRKFQSMGMMTNPAVDRFLWMAAVAILAVAAVVFYTGGYHAGFMTINGYAHHFPAAFLQSLTFVGDTLAALALLFILARGDHRMFWLIFVTAIIGTLITHGLKESFMADRPPAVLPAGSFYLTGPKVTRVSFPSGHTLTAFCMAGVMLYHYRSLLLRSLFLLLAASAGISRSLVGVHWPMDELVGASAGLFSVYLAVLVCRRYPIGLGLKWQTFIQVVMVGCLVALFFHDGGYTLARPFAWALAGLGLLVALYQYVYRPMQQQH